MIGFAAGQWNTTGSDLTFAGYCAGYCNTTGSNNTFIGRQSGFLNTFGGGNVFVGGVAGCCNTTASLNTFIGTRAGCTSSTGCCNTYVGSDAGRTMTTGNNNVILGAGGNASSATVSNEATIFNGTNTARFQGAATSWTFTSDIRDKQNIIDLNIGRDFLRDVKPRRYEWNLRHTEIDRGKPAAGFIAQEVLEVVENHDVHYTNLVDTNDGNQYTLALSNFIPIIVKAIQELDTENQELKIRIQNLETSVGIATTS